MCVGKVCYWMKTNGCLESHNHFCLNILIPFLTMSYTLLFNAPSLTYLGSYGVQTSCVLWMTRSLKFSAIHYWVACSVQNSAESCWKTYCLLYVREVILNIYTTLTTVLTLASWWRKCGDIRSSSLFMNPRNCQWGSKFFFCMVVRTSSEILYSHWFYFLFFGSFSALEQSFSHLRKTTVFLTVLHVSAFYGGVWFCLGS